MSQLTCGCEGGPAQPPSPAAQATDPVCGMKADTENRRIAPSTKAPYHFCSAGCRAKFAAGPEKYLRPKSADATPADPGGIYTCPMHPQIPQQGPGACSICGMALEPLDVSAEAAPNHELADMTRRFWIGLVLTLPVLVLEMGSHIPGIGLHEVVPPATSIWIQFALATPVVLWAGWPFFQRLRPPTSTCSR